MIPDAKEMDLSSNLLTPLPDGVSCKWKISIRFHWLDGLLCQHLLSAMILLPVVVVVVGILQRVMKRGNTLGENLDWPSGEMADARDLKSRTGRFSVIFH